MVHQTAIAPLPSTTTAPPVAVLAACVMMTMHHLLGANDVLAARTTQTKAVFNRVVVGIRHFSVKRQSMSYGSQWRGVPGEGEQ